MRRILIVLLCVLAACTTNLPNVYRPDLNDDIVNTVKNGDSEAAVVAKLGQPYRRIRFDNLNATAMDYRYRDAWGYWVDYSVMVGDDGRVAGRFSARIDDVRIHGN